MKKPPSKRELSHRKEATDMFVLACGVVVGVIAGLVVGLLKHRSLLFMQVGGVAGLGVGGLGLLAQAGWRKLRTRVR